MADTKVVRAPKRELIGLDVIRFAAALLVMCYHFGFWHWTAVAKVFSQIFVGRPPPVPELNFGWVGVEVFFVLSGFVIAFSAEGASASAFLRSRILRLVPSVWVCGTIALLLYTLVLHRDPIDKMEAYVCSLFFLPLKYVDDVYWTLSIEVSFYVLVFLMLRTRRIRFLEPLMAAIGLASGAFWMIALSLQTVLAHATGAAALLRVLVLKAEGSRYLQLLLVQHGCLFGLGVTLYAASMQGYTRSRSARLLALAACCVLEILGQNGIIERASGLVLSAGWAVAVWVLAVMLIALSVRYNAALTRRLGPLTRHGKFLGKMTYPLYLLHNSVGLAVTVWLAPLLGVAAVLPGMAVAVVVAGLVQTLAEPWARKGFALGLDRLTARLRAARAASNPSPAAPQ